MTHTDDDEAAVRSLVEELERWGMEESPEGLAHAGGELWPGTFCAVMLDIGSLTDGDVTLVRAVLPDPKVARLFFDTERERLEIPADHVRERPWSFDDWSNAGGSCVLMVAPYWSDYGGRSVLRALALIVARTYIPPTE